MAGGKTIPSVKKKPPHQIGMKLNKVEYGKGEEYVSDGSGRNKAAKALESPGIKAGKQPHVKMVENSGMDSPIGKTRPTQDGGPRPGQKSGVDRDVDSFPVQGNDFRGKRGPGKHGHSTNRYEDIYAAARKGDVRYPKD